MGLEVAVVGELGSVGYAQASGGRETAVGYGALLDAGLKIGLAETDGVAAVEVGVA